MLPLNATVTLLSSDTVGVVLRLEELAVAVAVDCSGHSSEELSAVCRGSALQQFSRNFDKSIFILLPSSSAGDLPGENVESFGCCKTTATIGQSHADGVRRSCPEFSVH